MYIKSKPKRETLCASTNSHVSAKSTKCEEIIFRIIRYHYQPTGTGPFI